MNKVRQYAGEMEQIRRKLHQAWERSGGNTQDPEVQRLAIEFDQIMMSFVQLPVTAQNGADQSSGNHCDWELSGALTDEVTKRII
ncbi:MAG TPA: hypothetical protein GXX57_02665 [Firmicutes bacterium]|nr:hypothetical protein [Bacillota bacterium]